MALFRSPAEALKLASFRNYASVHPAAAPGSGRTRLSYVNLFGRRTVVGFVPASSFLVTDPIRPALEDLFLPGACSGRNR